MLDFTKNGEIWQALTNPTCPALTSLSTLSLDVLLNSDAGHALMATVYGLSRRGELDTELTTRIHDMRRVIWGNRGSTEVWAGAPLNPLNSQKIEFQALIVQAIAADIPIPAGAFTTVEVSAIRATIEPVLRTS